MGQRRQLEGVIIGSPVMRDVVRSLVAGARPRIRRVLDARRPAAKLRPRSPSQLRAADFDNLTPIAVERINGRPMLTMVTDTIAPGYLFGGVGTAVLFAATLAREQGYGLRIVTRCHAPAEEPLRKVMALHDIDHAGSIELVFSPPSGGQAVPLGPNDIVLTTSWWTTHAALATIPAAQILYLLQEDERLFYAGGDQHLLCDEILHNTAVRYVVNTSLLLDHFRSTDTTGPTSRGVAFEPAFPETIYYPEPQGGRRRLLFYARPGHPRNLFLRGLAALEAAIAIGLFPPDMWDIHFVGVNIPPVDLGGRPIHYHDTIAWADYAALVRRCDLGLSLMYTPHPSYPPLDMAASGMVVVTNRCGVKQDLSGMSGNILTVPVTVEGLVEGLRQGAALAVDTARRQRQHRDARLSRRWADSFAPVLRHLAQE